MAREGERWRLRESWKRNEAVYCCGYVERGESNPDTNINTGKHFNDPSLWLSASNLPLFYPLTSQP